MTKTSFYSFDSSVKASRPRLVNLITFQQDKTLAPSQSSRRRSKFSVMAKRSPRRRRVTPGKKKLPVKAKKAKTKDTRPPRFGPTESQPTKHESEKQQLEGVFRPALPSPEPDDSHLALSKVESAALSSSPSTSPPPPVAGASDVTDDLLARTGENCLPEVESSNLNPVDQQSPSDSDSVSNLARWGWPSISPSYLPFQETDSNGLCRIDSPYSTYSIASSRTVSTDYGIYARRMALSQSSSLYPSPMMDEGLSTQESMALREFFDSCAAAELEMFRVDVRF
ncbi:hypothetical protein CVT26_004422 [Gymnopilus dilepis]|uniref:Uncharacterized protein n=1 Tax=Gymnopilus dilepis TaxID=231916 RepID=A0A409X1N1_9AGAR|nr:hypothetical protein CVT26_004422 [Gymnopilus dilepis]